MNRLFRKCMSICCAGMLAGVVGCDSKPPAPPPRAAIIRMKIPAMTETVKPLTPTSVAVSPEKPSQDGTHPAPSAEAVALTHAVGNVAGTAGNSYDPATFVAYNPAGKIDPFVPLIKDEPPPAKAAQPQKSKKEKRVPTSPLELVDLSQLKLTAIIHTPSGNKAMVEESNGKGYVIGVGTYIGTHSGKVISIQKDKVVVEEEIEDALGNSTLHNSELKFQKPPGEF